MQSRVVVSTLLWHSWHFSHMYIMGCLSSMPHVMMIIVVGMVECWFCSVNAFTCVGAVEWPCPVKAPTCVVEWVCPIMKSTFMVEHKSAIAMLTPKKKVTVGCKSNLEQDKEGEEEEEEWRNSREMHIIEVNFARCGVAKVEICELHINGFGAVQVIWSF